MKDEPEIEEQHFSALINRVEKLDNMLTNINNNLEHEGYERLSLANNKKTLSKYVKDNPEKSGQYDLIDNYIKEAINISSLIKSHTSNYQKNWEIENKKRKDLFSQELNNQISTRNSERRDYWVLWGHKSIRWVVGFIVAIILYSSTVWIADEYGFIKIPIKDWIHGQPTP